MTNSHAGSGKCLCGAITFTAKDVKPNLGACHCGMCRQWGGGPFLALDTGAAVEFTGSELITVYKSSEWG